MSLLGAFAAPLVRVCCASRAERFDRALDDVAMAQQATLSRILQAAGGTAYAQSLGLACQDGMQAFRSKVPVADYAALEPWIQRQRNQGGAILTPGRIRAYEPTSGSSSAAKWIPYNDALLASFRSLFAIWAHDLLRRRLAPRSGRTFISISSSGGQAGFNDDRDYLGGMMRMLVSRFLVVPPQPAQPDDWPAFRDRLALTLAACADLEVISIWNPSYLLVLLQHFETHRARLLPALPAARRQLFAHDTVSWRQVWPDLQLISCWSDASAASPAARLQALFPDTFLQGKGLLATEAPITLPLEGAGGCVPLVDEVFIELEDSDGQLHLLHEVQIGAQYGVVVTQAGGLLRYRLGDRVSVQGQYRSAPLLQFIGRADAVSDLVGEKLGEDWVAQLMRKMAPTSFGTLLPVQADNCRPHYCLLTDCMDPALAHILENGLLQSYRYREARMLGQLDPVQVVAQSDMRTVVHNALIAIGFKAGDIKDRALVPSTALAQRIHQRIMTG